MAIELSNRNKAQLTLKEVIEKYSDVSPFAIIKADVQR